MTITPLMPVYPRCDVRPVRGDGCYLYGERGERYLDSRPGSRSTRLATVIRT
jgi:acetylornithine/N-succinyldiaminopimelate aminotransferase